MWRSQYFESSDRQASGPVRCGSATNHAITTQISSSLLLPQSPSTILVSPSTSTRLRNSSSGSSSSSRSSKRSRSITISMAVAQEISTTGTVRSREELNKGIAELYDESSGIWEDIWGDHMHHGYYDPSQPASLTQHRAAQIQMIEEALRFAGVSDDSSSKPKVVVDIGCGIGGSSRYLAKKFGATCQGITLSPMQAQRAQALAAVEGIADKAFFQVADALDQPFPDGQFDLVWSMESGEHMPDKKKFISELARVAAPGATIIIVTWCHRDLAASEESLRPDETELLRKICDAYYLPAWCSAADYVQLLESLSFQDIKTEDWSQYVAPFWPAVIRSALTWKGLTSLLRSGWKTIKGALAMPLMVEGYKKDLIKFAIITCRKPE
ncbi:probable tocopherol O-methyltransferase, chloroplastic isoform X1 [Beta vulgaris subsp. vulgaris]|uniref:probable tocopherol O-methyltransferase, chloroplastic isoform X1 n=1 Tax=Beta vulgaris subsp. vulgaris TaxID=3555 RepID=UPI002036E35E|nr:probable tocopherol O-methyltransferase, chloroplastic isoform X1 [Beta vulgaris subsp. vulgaris]